MVMVHTLKLIAFGLLGVALVQYLPLMLAMVAAASFANWIGAKVLHRMHEGDFRLLLKLVVTGLSLRLIWLAARDFENFEAEFRTIRPPFRFHLLQENR